MIGHVELVNSYVEQNEPLQLSDGFRPQFEGVSQWLNQAARAIAHALIGSSDPFIWQKIARHGNTWWMIDDPLTGNRFHALSEEEVRAWIDQRYYAQPRSIESTSHHVNPLLIERW
jgi:hypothetical protein